MERVYNFNLQDVGGWLTVQSRNLTEEGASVLSLLAGRKLTIGELTKFWNDFGAHPQHEVARKQTTPRKMFQIIRDLRDAGCPIVGDAKGLWVARSVQEVEAFAEHLEQKARADVASMLELRNSMLLIVQSKVPSLFDRVAEQLKPTNL